MGVVAGGLLVAGVLGALLGRRAIVRGGVPLLAALVAVLAGATTWTDARASTAQLVAPLALVLLAVPVAVVLEQEGVFRAVAARLPDHNRDLGLWVLAAVTVAVLNLDAAVVLLTPLYIAIGRRAGVRQPIALAAQPALVACLASSALPVGNLTNLIALDADRVSTGTFLRLLLLPSVVALCVGFAAWKRLVVRRFHPDDELHPVDDLVIAARALPLGAIVLAVLVVGFLGGSAVGVPPWAVMAVVLVGLVVVRRRPPALDRVPFPAAAIAIGLSVLATAVARSVDVGALLGNGMGFGGEARLLAVGAAGANLGNNLPAFLVGLPAVGDERAVAALLLAVNAGPMLLVTGTLSGVLWLDTARRAELRVTAWTYSTIGLLAGVPAFLAAATTFLLVR